MAEAAAKKTAAAAQKVVETAEELAEELKPAVTTVAQKVAGTVGFTFGMATTAVILVVAGTFTIAAARLSAVNVAHLLETRGKVWEDSAYRSS